MKRSLVVSLVVILVLAFGGLGAAVAAKWSPKLGLDLQGGLSVVYAPAHPTSSTKLDEAISIIRNRVDALGVAQPNIYRQGSDIVVQLPGIKNQNHALKIIGETAQLLFRPVLCAAPAYAAPSRGSKAPSGPPKCSTSALQGTIQGGQAAASSTSAGGAPAIDSSLASYPTTKPSADSPTKDVILPVKGDPTQRLVLGPAQATGAIISSATAQISQAGQWLVAFTTTGKGAKTLDALGKNNLHRFVAIDLDGQVESYPVFDTDAFHGQGQISGTFTQQQAKSLALVLRYGALPVQLTALTHQAVSPTLGKASLRAGLIAGLIGLALVLVYMIFYYRALGVVVVIGLAASASFLWVIISWLGRAEGLTLDLSGVTGLIVSVGVTVDSYVVYFERLKDDLRSGRTVRSSTERGFKRALRTIVAADLVSLIGAALLWLLSVAQVKGFAFMLGLSTALDLVVTYFFTRPMVIWLGRHRTFTDAPVFGVARGLAAERPTTQDREREGSLVG